jgi:hypothetical protein
MNARKAEIRSIVLDILSGKERVTHEPTAERRLWEGVAEVMVRSGKPSDPRNVYPENEKLNTEDALLFSEVFQDFLSEKIITPGLDLANPTLPHFKIRPGADLSH